MTYAPSPSWLRHVAAGALAATLWSGSGLHLLAQAPTLGELAQKEQERRKALKTSGKVYSNRDLPQPPPATSSAAPGTAAPSTATPGAATPESPLPPDKVSREGWTEAKPGPDDTAKNEAAWHSRMSQAQEAQRRGAAFAEALQSRINALSAEAVNRDDPYQRAKAAEDRQKAIGELERVTEEIERAKKEITTIEEDARKAGVPPGWVR